MRIKECFTVPEGTKVTEKIFSKVLLSSICSILLCMACLASTTWAWFAVSIDNKGNEIQIASVRAGITIENANDNSKIDTNSEEGGCILEAGTYDIGICLDNTASGLDDLNRQQNDVYVVMTVTHNTESKSYYFTFAGQAKEDKKLSGIQIGNGAATVSFAVSWIKPASATPVGSEAVVIGEIPTEPTTATATGAITVAHNRSVVGSSPADPTRKEKVIPIGMAFFLFSGLQSKPCAILGLCA